MDSMATKTKYKLMARQIIDYIIVMVWEIDTLTPLQIIIIMVMLIDNFSREILTII
jgi:hypothetical protein